MVHARNRSWEVLAFAVACALGLAVNAWAFPMFLAPDSGDYLGAARDILRVLQDDASSLIDVGMKFRILGYPALLAGLDSLAPKTLNPALYLLQASFAILSGVLLFALLRRLEVNLAWAVLLAGLYVAAWPRHLSGFMLTDAIHNALTAVTVCLLVEPLFRDMRVSWGRILTAGTLVALAFLLRESNRYLVVCYLPILLVLAWKQDRTARALLLVPLFVLPLLVTIEAYKAFNAARFGERIVTTGGRTAMLQPLLPVARRHADFFSGPSPLDASARGLFKEYRFAEILRFNSHWHSQGVSEERLADWAFGKYFEAWRRYPLEMVRDILWRYQPLKQATELLNPPGTLHITRRWREPSIPSERQRLVALWKAGDVLGLLVALPTLAGRLPSLLIYLLFFVGAPIVAVKAWRRGERVLALGLGALLVTYVGYGLVFSLVHMAMRYLGGVAVLPVIGAALAVMSLRRYRGKLASGAV